MNRVHFAMRGDPSEAFVVLASLRLDSLFPALCGDRGCIFPLVTSFFRERQVVNGNAHVIGPDVTVDLSALRAPEEIHKLHASIQSSSEGLPVLDCSHQVHGEK